VVGFFGKKNKKYKSRVFGFFYVDAKQKKNALAARLTLNCV
jgi:hypothetical protein